MMNPRKTGSSGKGFYAALSLSLAMVGAACWYAYSHTGTKKPERTAPAQTTAVQVTTTRPPETTAATESQPAEQAAALFHRKTTLTEYTTTTTTTSVTTVTFTVPAVTQAPVEQPLSPVQGKPILAFSHGELVKSGTTGIWETHNGTDFAAAIGSDVYCAMDGTVTEIKRDALWGVCVTVLHNDGTVTRYCGLNEALNVQQGDVLERGTVIGTVGNTNEAESAMEPHLHFEVMRNDAYIDAEFFLIGMDTQDVPAQDDAETEDE